MDDGCILEQRERAGEEFAQLRGLFRGDRSLRRFGMHRPPLAVPGDLDHSALRVRGEAVVPGVLDLRAEDRKTLRPEGIEILWSEMEDGMSRRAEFRC